MNPVISPTPGLSRRPRARLFPLIDPALAVWMRLANSRSAAYVFFGAVYIWPTVMLAGRKLLWDDEFFTLYLSKTQTWNGLIAALGTGADQHPPSFYYLTHLIGKLAGMTHVTFRLPAIIGFGLACLCLYEIVSRILTRPWGMAAMFLPLTMTLYYYASEGRGYALELGFLSLSVLMWMLACDGRRRAITIPLLAAGLCGAVASHYYAILALAPLTAGEIVRTKVRRKLDIPVWLAFGGALIPLAAFARTILSASSYSKHFWAVPHVFLAVDWYVTTLGYAIFVPAGAFALIILFRAAEPSPRSAIGSRIHPWDSTAILLLALLPVFGVVIAELVTHAYTERYMIAACVGVCILLILGVRRVIGDDRLGPAFVCVICLLFFAWQVRGLNRREFNDLEETRNSAAFLRRTGDAPIAMAEVTRFHRLSFYARRDLVRRLAYVADPHLSTRYLGHDTIDRGLLALNPWFPLNVVWWRDWLSSHPSFLVYGYVGDWTWLAFDLPSIGNVQLVKREELSRLLFSVENVRTPADDRTSADPSGEPMLYRKFAGVDAPLCEVYMAGGCPVVDGGGGGGRQGAKAVAE